jgi:polysaccharide biosynthesis/export protein
MIAVAGVTMEAHYSTPIALDGTETHVYREWQFPRQRLRAPASLFVSACAYRAPPSAPVVAYSQLESSSVFAVNSRRIIALLAAALTLGCAPTRNDSPGGVPTPQPLATLAHAAAAASAPAAADAPAAPSTPTAGTRIGPNDELAVGVFEAPELDRTVRVAGSGMISLPLLGEVRAAGLTPRELELLLEESFRTSYIRDPHVSVRITDLQSRAVSVLGAVSRPGVFQLAEPRPLLQVIALAGGLAREAGAAVIVERVGGGSVEIPVAELAGGAGARPDLLVHPGDVVKVTSAGVVYVVGAVRRPGGFPLDSRTGLTVLQAIALGEGLAAKAAKGRTTVIRTGDGGERVEIRVDLGDVLAGRAPDLRLQARDVVYVPNSAVKSVAIGAVDALVSMVTIRQVF